jgi:hypothetical protein
MCLVRQSTMHVVRTGTLHYWCILSEAQLCVLYLPVLRETCMAGELNSNIRDRCCPELHIAFTACLVINIIFFFKTKSFG